MEILRRDQYSRNNNTFIFISILTRLRFLLEKIFWTEKEKKEQPKLSLSMFIYELGEYEARGTILKIILGKLLNKFIILIFFFLLLSQFIYGLEI